MSENTLDVIRKTIQQDGFFEAVVASVNDWDDALDRRDDDVFDKALVQCFGKIKSS